MSKVLASKYAGCHTAVGRERRANLGPSLSGLRPSTNPKAWKLDATSVECNAGHNGKRGARAEDRSSIYEMQEPILPPRIVSDLAIINNHTRFSNIQNNHRATMQSLVFSLVALAV